MYVYIHVYIVYRIRVYIYINAIVFLDPQKHHIAQICAYKYI